MFRQGDVLLIPVRSGEVGEEIPRDEQARIVLAHGEATGHAHAIHDPGAVLRASLGADDERFLQVTAGMVTLRHEEHSPINLRKGLYRVVRQREYDPSAPERGDTPMPDGRPRSRSRYVAD